MADTPKHTCEYPLLHGFSLVGCGRFAKYLEHESSDSVEPRWFCGMHAPSQREARRQKRDEERERVMAPVRAKQAADRRMRDAAPDLLEALKAAVADSEDGTAIISERTLVLAITAIAKAEGR